ncbi:hypothetical protein RS130_05225 [Paraglaciecola aquimarina]|uniref:Fibronectin type-III domain-containing protein n=1 Tax=Paraglaciecola aquimarina TaxID=1235557 RepID=A0ABU3STT2_9ALTE|nr:hypothetical protein [Paraglaciecola aquimarina]MDU0353411.1 hypothetical protein [Paraglaciecola aquimarina]
MRYLQVVKSIAFLSMFFCLIFNSTTVFAQIVLMGDNAPYENVNDGNFSTDWATWRKGLKPPFWQTKAVQGAHETPMALHLGSLFSMHDVGVATSKILDTHPRYQTPKTGDVINWGFGADLEYISDGRISLSLVFGEHERILANKVKLKGSDKIIEHFSGQYVISKEDADAGLPYVKATFYSSEGIKVYLHYVNISVVDDNKKVTNLRAVAKATSVELSWLDNSKNSATEYVIYRGRKNVKANIYTKVLTNYTKLGTTEKTNFVDHDFITGVEYTYLVVRREALATSISEKVKINVSDVIPPSPPTQLKAEALDAEILLSWQKIVKKMW